MYPFYLEIELIKPVINYFQSQGYQVRREVKIGFCRADIVAFKNRKTTAIELKLNNWKKAISQAKNYQLGADFVYIAFPLMKSFKVMKKAEHIFQKEGIGFLIINEETCKVRELIKAKKSMKNFSSIIINEVDKRRNIRKKF